LIISSTVLLTEPAVAVMVVEAAAVTTAGVKLKEALVAPAGTVTKVPGGIVVPSELEMATVTPPGPAVPAR
jgi:hypothetical protein